jgi:hypothetical protein
MWYNVSSPYRNALLTLHPVLNGYTPGCLDGNNVPIVRRAAAAALARLVRFTDDERDHNGIVFAYARGLLPLLVQLTVSPDEEVCLIDCIRFQIIDARASPSFSLFRDWRHAKR